MLLTITVYITISGDPCELYFNNDGHYYSDDNEITFGRSIQGVSNPITAEFGNYEVNHAYSDMITFINKLHCFYFKNTVIPFNRKQYTLT